jgi:hypothetical protein
MNNNQSEYLAEIIKSGLNFDFRHAQYAASEILTLKGKARKKRLTQYGNELNFLTNRSLEYGFYRYLKREMKQDKWVKRHKTELAFFLLLDLLYPEHATLKGSREEPFDLPDDLRIFLGQRLSTRQSRRILREEYPELFFSPPKSIPKKVNDDRLNPFTSVFSVISLNDTPESVAAMELLTMQELAFTKYRDFIDERREVGAHLRMVDPDDLEDLHEFMGITNHVIQLLSMTYGPVGAEHSKWIGVFKEGTGGFDAFHSLIESAIALRWYRNLKSETKQKAILREHYPLNLSKKEITKVIDWNMRWFNDPVTVCDLIHRGASGYMYSGEFDIAKSLYQECLDKIPLEDWDKGLCHHNLAWLNKLSNDPELYLKELKETLRVFQEINRGFDIAVTYAYMADAYFLLNSVTKSKAAKKKAIATISKSQLTDFEYTNAYLHFAGCARYIGDKTWEYDSLLQGLEYSSKLEDDEYFLYINQYLLDLNAGRDPHKMKREYQLKKPQDAKWIQVGSDLFIPVLPRTVIPIDSNGNCTNY